MSETQTLTRPVAINFDQLSLSDIVALRAQIDNQIVVQREQAKHTLATKWMQEAESYGLTIGDVLPGYRPGGATRTGTQTANRGTGPGASTSARRNRTPINAPRYKNPHGTETWSGRGNKPTWYKTMIAQGIDPETCRIGAGASSTAPSAA